MQQEYFGIGSVHNLASILAEEKPQNIFLVCGGNSYRACGAEKAIESLLRPYNVTRFTAFSPNVKIEDIKKGLATFRENKCDFTLAVGGGSAVDLAKAVAILSADPDHPEEYIRKKIHLQTRIISLAVIPTTAGTGSEATHFAVLYIDKEKYSLAHPSLVPDYALIDPSFTLSLSAYQTACTGIDALAQAIESFWSIHSTQESKEYARKAISLALLHLEKAVNNPGLEDRVGMAKAANLAGKAINVSFTTACHAVSYPITSYFNVPHGHAVALTLAEMIMYNAEITEKECFDKRGIGYVQETMQELCGLFGVGSADEMKIKVELLLDNIGLERKLGKLQIITDQDLEIIIKHGFNPERVKNNPRLVTEQNLRKILQDIR